MGYTALQIASSAILFIGTGLVLAGMFTSYWSYYHVQIAYAGGSVRNMNATGQGHRGLIWTCHDDEDTLYVGAVSCISRFKDYSKAVRKDQTMSQQFVDSISYKPWELASLIMLSLSVIFGFGAHITAPLCCQKCGHIHSSFVYLAALNAILGMSVYVGFQMQSSMSLQTTLMKFDKFGWSFYTSIFGTLLQLLSAVLYTVSACCYRSNRDYQKGVRE